jgi:hypothetical protein
LWCSLIIFSIYGKIHQIFLSQNWKNKINHGHGMVGPFFKGNAWPIIPPSNLEEWFTQVTPKTAFFSWLGNKCFPTIPLWDNVTISCQVMFNVMMCCLTM